MNKLKNILKDKYLDFKQYVTDNRKKSAFFAVLLFSFIVYFVVFASTITYELKNQSIKISGEDVTNNSISNFGSVNYTVSYDLSASEESTEDNILSTDVYVNVLIPNSFLANVSISDETLQPVQGVSISGYTYYKKIINENVGLNKGTVIKFDSLHTSTNQTNATFKPIITVSLDDNLDVNNPSLNNLVTDNLTITSTARLSTNVINNSPIVNGTTAILPIGVMYYIPLDKLKGSSTVTNINFKINYEITSTGSTSLTDEEKANLIKFKEYNTVYSNVSSDKAYYYKDSQNYVIQGLYNTNEETNGKVTYNSSTNTISINDIKTDVLENTKVSSNGQKYVLLTSNIFFLEIDTSKAQLKFDYIVTTDSPVVLEEKKSISTGTTTVVGSMDQNVNFQNPLTEEVNTDLFENIYGDNSEFEFYVTDYYYAPQGYTAFSLTNFATFIKLDKNFDDVEVEEIYLNSINRTLNLNTITYYKQDWSTLVNTCSSSEYTEDENMAFYGGKCASESTNKVNAKTEGITVIKFQSPENESIVLNPGSKIVFKIKAKIKNNSNLVNERLQILASSLASSNQVYYFNENQTFDKNSSQSTSGVNGNVVKVIASKGNTANYKTYVEEKNEDEEDVFEEITTPIYSGREGNDPFIWNFDPYVGLASNTEIKKVNASVTIPKTNGYEYLEFQNAFLTKETDSIFTDDSNMTLPYTRLECSKTESDSCSYEIVEDNNQIVYNFTIIGDDAIKSFINNGLFVKTGVALITPTTTVKMNFNYSCNLETSTSSSTIESETKSSSIEAEKSIITIRSKVSNSGGLKTDNSGEVSSTLKTNLNIPYTYYMNTIVEKDSSITKLEQINILPYNSQEEQLFHGTYTVKLNTLPSGYTAYYLSKEHAPSRDINEIKDSTNWKELNDSLVLNNEDVVAIKVVMNDISSLTSPFYFGGNKNLISLVITPSNNEYGDVYNNTFYVNSGENIYDTKISELSTFNRSISGIAFEDYDADGFYSLGENIFKDLEVELYKAEIDTNNIDNIDYNDPSAYVSSGTKIGESIYSTEEGYKFEKLDSGSYFLKIKFNSEKYRITDFEKEDYSMGDYVGNSKFKVGTEENIAISKLIKLDSNSNININNVNLGLKIKQSFNVEVNKYIKNIKVIKSTGTQNYDYDHEKTVKLDFRDLSDTSFEVTYGFDIKNTRYFPGYIGAIVEAIPTEMEFDSSLSQNVGWEKVDDLLYYNGLSDTLIMPDNVYSFEITLKIPNNMAGDFINIISVGDLRILETSEETNDSTLEESISTLGIKK